MATLYPPSSRGGSVRSDISDAGFDTAEDREDEFSVEQEAIGGVPARASVTTLATQSQPALPPRRTAGGRIIPVTNARSTPRASSPFPREETIHSGVEKNSVGMESFGTQLLAQLRTQLEANQAQLNASLSTQLDARLSPMTERLQALESQRQLAQDDEAESRTRNRRRVTFEDTPEEEEIHNNAIMRRLADMQAQLVGLQTPTARLSKDSFNNPMWANRGGVYARRIGAAVPGLETLEPIDETFIPLMNYRRYRLDDTRTTLPNAKGISKTRDNMKSMLPQKFSFDGKDPIQIFHFLERLASKADDLSLNERTLWVIVPNFLSSSALTTYQAALTAGGHASRPVESWPSAVNYMLKRYATDENIKQAADDILKIAQAEDEDEDDYFIRFEEANLRAGSSLDARRKITLLINGFDSAIRPYLSRFFQSKPMATILDVLEEAKVEGKTNRARNKSRRKRPSAVNFMGRHQDDSSSEEDANGEISPDVQSFLCMTQGEPSSGEITADFHEESAFVFAATGSGFTPARSYGNPGWKNPAIRKAAGRFTRLADVCERCYERGIGRKLPHAVSTGCTATLPRDKDSIMDNFSRLALWEIGKVQLNLILRACGKLNDQTYTRKYGSALLALFCHSPSVGASPVPLGQPQATSFTNVSPVPAPSVVATQQSVANIPAQVTPKTIIRPPAKK